MKHLLPSDSWPQSWKESYLYDLQEVYRQVSHRGYTYAYQNRRKQTLRFITEVLPPGSRILDIAAAQGNFSLTLAEMGFEVTWNDLRGDLADYVRQKHERGAIHFAPGNVFELKFPSQFDGVLIAEIIEHVAHPDEFLSTTAQLVRPGGYIVMSTPNGAYFRNTLPKFSECYDPSIYEVMQFKPNADGHIFLLYPDEVQSLATHAGLRLEKLILCTNPLTTGHIKTEHLLRLLPRRVVDWVESATMALPARLSRPLQAQIIARLRRE